MKNILTEAFKQLSEIDQNVFNADENGLNKLDAFITDSDNESENVTVIIDPNAEDETDLQDSYIGKILCRCVVCQSDIMKDESELHKDEDCPDVVNCGEECPMCQSTEGYKIIGRIAPYEEAAPEEPAPEEPQEVTSEPEVAEDVLEEAADNKKLTNIEKIAKKFPELNLLKESVDCVNVVSDGQEVEVKPEGDRTTITISPVEENVEEAPVEAPEEVVAPLDDEEKEEIDTMLDEPEDIEIDEFDEEQFDDLGESFLKKVYEDVDSYKTTSGIINGDKLMLEGIITFKSGKQGKTNFVFESHSITKTGKLKFIGENLQFAKNKAFVLTGKADGKKLIAESLNYRYSIKDEEGKSHPLYGTVKK